MATTLPDYARRLREHYAPLVREHGATHRAVDWGSARSQEARFRVLLEAGGAMTARVLDVGCGVGHLVDHLKSGGFSGRYLGLDLVPEMVTAAVARHPHWEFRGGSIADSPVEFSSDYIVASGLFTFTDQTQLEQCVTGMFQRTSRVVAFNTLSAWGDEPAPGEFCADPLRVVEFCRTLTRRVVLRHDYLPHDFTVYLYREEAAP
jgi:SAM-dependent methyltransferase